MNLDTPYTVTYKFNGKEQTDRFSRELTAVRMIDHLERVGNAEVVSVSANIDRSKYRY